MTEAYAIANLNVENVSMEEADRWEMIDLFQMACPWADEPHPDDMTDINDLELAMMAAEDSRPEGWDVLEGGARHACEWDGAPLAEDEIRF